MAEGGRGGGTAAILRCERRSRWQAGRAIVDRPVPALRAAQCCHSAPIFLPSYRLWTYCSSSSARMEIIRSKTTRNHTKSRVCTEGINCLN